MTKLKRLKINKFRNVEPVELHFSDGFNVLLGINGSGKTTFLELIAALISRNFSKLRGEEFSVDYDVWFEEGTIEIELKNQIVEPADDYKGSQLTVLHRHEAELLLKTSVQINLNSQTKALALANQYTRPDDFLIGSLGRLRTLQPAEADSMLDVATTSRHLVRFDESLELLRMFEINRGSPQGWITFLGNRDHPERGLFFLHGWEPISVSLLAALEKQGKHSWQSWQEPHSLTIPMDGLPFLAQMVDLAGMKDAFAELTLLSKGSAHSGSADQLVFGNLRFWFVKEDASRWPDQMLSYGQKRLLSFLYCLDCNPHIIIADELTNGLHHAWIASCLEAIGDRQAFLASQNPLLVDELEFSSPDDVKRAFILCRCDTSSGKERLVWSHMSDDDAERFFEAYEVGLQHVSEILRTKNLW